MDLDNLIIATYCSFDDAEKAVLQEIGIAKLRRKGPQPAMTDAEVMTIEIVGELIGINQDKRLFLFFRRNYSHFFPALRKINRITFIRQAFNLWRLKEFIWQYLLRRIDYDHSLAIVDSLPLPACQFARANRCMRFFGYATYGFDVLARQTFYGFRIHVYLAWPGVITAFSVAPANVHETKAVPELVNETNVTLLGDRNYWSPELKEELSWYKIDLEAPFRKQTSDPWPERSGAISKLRYRIDTVFGQLTERFSIKKVWARNRWHLFNRLLRKVLGHTLAFMLNQELGNEPLQFELLLP